MEPQDLASVGSEVDLKAVNEEYRIWKKNAPFLYDLVVTHALEWPSLTCQWLEKKTTFADHDYNEQELLLGTHTSGDQQNHLMIARVRLPNEGAEIDARKYDDERGELGGYGGTSSKIEIKVRINHDGEVNRARYMPQDDYVIATKTVTGQVHVFTIRDHESTPAADGPATPNIRLKGHEQEGYGIDWNTHTRGLLASASDDTTVCIWDTQASTVDSEGMDPLHKIKAHDDVVGDVQWHKFHKDMFGTVGDDCRLNIFDTRSLDKPKFSVLAHEKEMQALSFSPFHDFLLVTGGNDQVIKLWDMRKLDNSLHTFSGHQGDIFKVEWAPFSEAVFSSCSTDRRVIVWDLSRIGQEQTPADAEDGPPEMLFVHGGHTGKVSDVSWNAKEPWMLSSVSEDNILQVWQMAENIYAEDGADQQDEEGQSNVMDTDLE
mmetsp:Transcript_9480/g.16592  ORF Transcript_9480/g.16592 Transcript_9480/m.16592 type:complete len:432 (-) Transcript_9480:69-1364(-)|eukprot:CAMPEP_0184541188 /NCGR_PEP_ID=MMETSP0199_2-20130426/1238_1 /TAXON_ID=1112570 /ORGANISM="Thraustochytrium sp., Strain LLF1b" /LENGTH=431 /DNA_ID=CAMNT_0026934899 /DNA_START=297 /DNA_END=1592 /DNA_ORIENTATION=+